MGNIFSSFIQSPLPMFILMFAVLYFVLIRPQIKEQKNTKAMIDNIKKADRVITKGGMIGKIVEFQGKDNQYIIIDNEAGSRIKLFKSSIVSLLEK